MVPKELKRCIRRIYHKRWRAAALIILECHLMCAKLAGKDRNRSNPISAEFDEHV